MWRRFETRKAGVYQREENGDTQEKLLGTLLPIPKEGKSKGRRGKKEKGIHLEGGLIWQERRKEDKEKGGQDGGPGGCPSSVQTDQGGRAEREPKQSN